MSKSNWIGKWRSVAPLVAIGLSGYALWQSWQINADTSYLSLVQSRIAICSDLSAHHFRMAERDNAEGYDERENANAKLIVDGSNKNSTTGEENILASNYDRAVVSIGLARALDLCTVGKSGADEVASCINENITGNPDYNALDDMSSLNAPYPHAGKLNPAC
jgi:hypothetical protein